MTDQGCLEKVLVTGATGYVGSNLCRKLVASGVETHIIVQPSSSLLLLEDLSGSLAVHSHDGSSNSMDSILAQAKPHIVFHLASRVIVDHRPEDIAQLITSNITFGCHLLESMAANGCDKLINTGTYWQHYNNKAYCPVNLYAATKKAFEDVIEFYHDCHHMKAITLKLFDIYGPDDPRPKLLNLLKNTMETRHPLAMSPGEQLIDMVFIDDVVDAFLIAAGLLSRKPEMVNEAYCLSSGNPIQLKDLVLMVSTLCRAEIPINWGGRPYRQREVFSPFCAETVLPGWQPKVDISKGIKMTFKKQAKCQ